MVNVEDDVLWWPEAYLNQKAIENNVVFSMAYGDQPAAICELVDWVRTNGFELVAAGKGMKNNLIIDIQHQIRYGIILVGQKRKYQPVISILKCTIPLQMELKQQLKWLQLLMLLV